MSENSYLPKTSTDRLPKLSEKTEKKLVKDVLKDPKTSIEKIKVNCNFEKTWSFQQNYGQKDHQKSPVIFRKKWQRKMKAAEFSFYVLFSDETRAKLSSE